MIGSLATRVRELSLRVAQREGELEAARRRVAVYEEFDTQVQDSLSAALRAANQIRERAKVTAEAIAEEARAQRPQLAAELDAMRIERDALRRAIADASSSGAPRAAGPVATFPMSEMRTAAAVRATYGPPARAIGARGGRRRRAGRGGTGTGGPAAPGAGAATGGRAGGAGPRAVGRERERARRRGPGRALADLLVPAARRARAPAAGHARRAHGVCARFPQRRRDAR